MGQRSATETLFGLVAAFVGQRTWTQAELARRLETKTETVRKHLVHLQAGGFPISREEEHPHVYWSVPKNWFPGLLAFQRDEVPDLLRLLARSERGALHSRLLATVVERLRGAGSGFPAPDASAVRHRERAEDEERWLAIVEDAIGGSTALKMRYFATSQRRESWRHVSPHRLDFRGHTTFIATCHRTRVLKRFRLSNILEARLDRAVAFLAAAPDDVDRYEATTLAGFRAEGPVVACSFFVREPEATWVTRNLPDERIEAEEAPHGMRFRIETSSVSVLARFVVGLGSAAWCETPELAAEVHQLAKGALANEAS